MQGPTKGESPAHKNFPDEMAIKTVKNRLLKADVNASDDADLFSGDEDDMPTRDPLLSTVQDEIDTNANKKSLEFSQEPTIDNGTGDNTKGDNGSSDNKDPF